MEQVDGKRPALTLTRRGKIAVLTLARPPVNAINAALLDDLYNAREEIAQDPSIGAVVVRSSQRFFCPGVDINMIGGFLHGSDGARQMVKFIRRIQGFFELWHQLPVPTIAAMAGTATGGGLEFGLASDFRVASVSARYGLPEAKIGLLPAAGGTQRLSRIAGVGVATRLIMTGDLVSGAEAERLGIVHFAVTPEEVENMAFSLAERLCQGSTAAIREIKACIALAPSAAGFTAEVDASARLLDAPESMKMVDAFLSRPR